MSFINGKTLCKNLGTKVLNNSGSFVNQLLSVVSDRVFYGEQIRWSHLRTDYFREMFKYIPKKLSDREYTDSCGYLDKDVCYDVFIYNNIPIISKVSHNGDRAPSLSLSVLRTKKNIKTMKLISNQIRFALKRNPYPVKKTNAIA
jgi:hypothetical protein